MRVFYIMFASPCLYIDTDDALISLFHCWLRMSYLKQQKGLERGPDIGTQKCIESLGCMQKYGFHPTESLTWFLLLFSLSVLVTVYILGWVIITAAVPGVISISVFSISVYLLSFFICVLGSNICSGQYLSPVLVNINVLKSWSNVLKITWTRIPHKLKLYIIALALSFLKFSFCWSITINFLRNDRYYKMFEIRLHLPTCRYVRLTVSTINPCHSFTTYAPKVKQC